MLKELEAFLNTQIPEAKAVADIREAGDSVLYVSPSALLPVAQLLRDAPEYQFHVLQVITGCDFFDEGIIEVSYILANFIQNTELILKVKLPRDNPQVDSLCSVWKAANFQERECYDMLGVNFKGHPDPRRILCPDDWEGFPLRKDYVAAKMYRDMEIYPDDKMNFPDREFIVRAKGANNPNQEDSPEATS